MASCSVRFYTKEHIGFGSPCHPLQQRPPPPPWRHGWTWWWPLGAPGGQRAAVHSVRRSGMSTLSKDICCIFKQFIAQMDQWNSAKSEEIEKLMKNPGHLGRGTRIDGTQMPDSRPVGQQLKANFIKHDLSNMTIANKTTVLIILIKTVVFLVVCLHKTLHFKALIKWKQPLSYSKKKSVKKKILCVYFTTQFH